MGRLPFIDWTRGFAVVAMILWHTGDGWLRADQRTGQSWQLLRFVGGLAAPSFLFLAGVSAALAARAQLDEAGRNRAFRGSSGRALEVLLIGYLLRFQTWLLDASALIRPGMLRAWLPLGIGYGTLIWSTKRFADQPRRAARFALLGALLCSAGLVQVESVSPGRIARLLQVDVLQAIGVSLFLLALGERGFGLLTRPAWLLALSAFVAVSTDAVTRALPGPLPPALAAYFGKIPGLPGGPQPSLFPLFPWLAYPLAGAAVGGWLKRVRADHARLTVWLAVLGAALACCTSEAHPFIHRAIDALPWLVHPIRITFRVGIVLVMLLVGWVWSSGSGSRRGRWLLALGQNSLRVYWAHMLFAYGVFGRPLQKHVDFAVWAAWLVPLLLAMWLLTRIGAEAPSGPRLAPQHRA